MNAPDGRRPGSWTVGVNTNYNHDLAFALVDGDGAVRYVGEEERFTRIRHSGGALPSAEALTWGLRWLGLERRHLGRVALGQALELIEAPTEREATRLTDDFLLTEWGLGGLETCRFPHHLAHAASSFFPSGFEAAAVLSVDGIGEAATCAAYSASGDIVESLWERTRHSIGLVYLAITRWLGIGTLGDEGKTMGLSSYGVPRLADLFQRSIISWDPGDGSFEVAASLLDSNYSVLEIEAVLGPRRTSGEPLTDHHRDVAATVQLATEEIMMGLCRRLRAETGHRLLCLAGGVALNSVSNGRIVEAGIFEDSFIPPWGGDQGTAIGAALLAFHSRKSPAPRWRLAGNACLGRPFLLEECLEEVRRRDLPHELDEDPARRAAVELSRGRVVAWCQGRAEVGPRALGNRSILANAMIPDIADTVNRKVKFREPWRPFAPSILAEDLGRYVDWDGEAPYMVTVHRFREGLASEFPGVVHVDGTARVHSVTATSNPAFHRLLCQMRELTGHGLVLNTSYNIKGEPIVNTPAEAVMAFLSSDVDVLVMSNVVLDKTTCPRIPTERFNYQLSRLRSIPVFPSGAVAAIVNQEYWDANQRSTGPDSFARAMANLEAVVREVTLLVAGPQDRMAKVLAGNRAVKRWLPLSEAHLQERPGWDALVLMSEATLFNPTGLASLRRLSTGHGLPAFVMVRDATLLPAERCVELWELWRQAWFTHPGALVSTAP